MKPTHNRISKSIPTAAARMLSSARNPYTTSLATHQPMSMHESTLRRLARRAGLLARKHPRTGWSLIDTARADRPSIAGPGLTGEDVVQFVRDWQRGGDALQRV